MSSCKVRVIVNFSETWIFSADPPPQKNTQTPNFLKIRPVGAELFHADGWTNMTKLFAILGKRLKKGVA
jgi:hypothetical protein